MVPTWVRVKPEQLREGGGVWFSLGTHRKIGEKKIAGHKVIGVSSERSAYKGRLQEPESSLRVQEKVGKVINKLWPFFDYRAALLERTGTERYDQTKGEGSIKV